jgi:hypothetical protein
MPICYENQKEIFAKNGVSICRADTVQRDHNDNLLATLGTRYLVCQGDWMIVAVTLERAEEIMSEVLSGERTLGPEQE